MGKGSLPNENRPYTPELKVYAGDKFHAPAYAKISDLKITPLETPDGACLPKSMGEILANGCSYDKVVASLQHKLSNGDPRTGQIIPCHHPAPKELEYHLPSNITDPKALSKVCVHKHNKITKMKMQCHGLKLQEKERNSIRNTMMVMEIGTKSTKLTTPTPQL